MTKLLGLAVLAATTALTAQAFAATTSQTFFTGSSPFTTAPAQAQAPAFTNNIQVASFNSALGTLNSVTITLNGSSAINASVTNIRPAGGASANFSNANASVGLTGSVQGSPAFFSQTVTANPFSGTVAAGSVVDGGTVTTSFSDLEVLTGAAAQAFVGNGTTTRTLVFSASDVSASGTGVQNVTFFGGEAFITATINVAFDFTPAPPVGVPEPASLALLGLGLAAVGVIRRRV